MSTLDKATDDLTELLLAAESKLTAMGLSVSASVPLTIEKAVSDEEQSSLLTFGKYGKDQVWGLHVGGVPIKSCSRAKRVAAAHVLQHLKNELIQVHDTWLTHVCEATTVATSFLTSLEVPKTIYELRDWAAEKKAP